MPLLSKEQLFGSGNSLYTGSLFWELRRNPDSAVFTVGQHPHPDYIPFKPLYLSYAISDPTEYTFAIEVFGEWAYWARMAKNKAILNFLSKCREERDVAIESNAVKEIIKESLEGKSRFQAAKFLAQKGYKDYVRKPTKYSKENQIASDIEADLERLLA